MGKIILITGGARSGKSCFAEKYAARYGKNIAYIATAQVYDDEMRRRVDLHQKRRPVSWATYEAPYDAESVVMQAAHTADLILFDCLTLYLSNMLCAASMPTAPDARYTYVKTRICRLIDSAKQSDATVVFVTNEVGMGIVPLNAMAREYRDLAGLTNQFMAEAAKEVYLVISGLAVDVKKIAEQLESDGS